VASPGAWIEGEAVAQLEGVAKLPGMRAAIGMPDLHPGKGSPIGAAFVCEGLLYPHLVGNDIGCGMGLWATDLLKRKAKRDRWADRLDDLDGPWDIVEIAGSVAVGSVDVAVAGFYPGGGPTPGPYPLVVVAHGFQLPPTQYTGYVRRLATHGYVAVTADFQAGLFGTDHLANAQQVLAAIDWAADEPTLAGVVDTGAVGLTGHSLGGKLAVHGAALDPRVRASITLDPVDGSQMCDAEKCPDVTAMLPLDVPLGFLGETLDGSGGFMPCAPEADNFLTFFAAASAPALAVTVNGANHMSFLDDVAGCGFTCSFCKMPTLDDATVNRLARAYVVAFYGLHLKGVAGYETFLTGDAAQTRYVATGLVTLATK